MIGTFLASETRLLMRILASRGIDPVPLLRDAGIDPSLIEKRFARFPFGRVADAWSRSVAICKDDDLGLESAKFYQATDFHGLVVVFLASSDLATALARFARYHTVVNTALRMRLEHDAKRLELVGTPIKAEQHAVRALESGRTAIVLSLCRTAVGESLNPAQVALTFSRPADDSALRAFFRAPIVYDAPEWRLVFRREDAETPFLASNRDLARSNDQVLDRAVRNLRQDDLVSRVKLAVVDALPSGAPSEQAIAKSLSLSSRSLQRRLAAVRAKFTDLVSDVRRELATEYVTNGDISVTEITYMLGFSDVSSFSRAFKRWTGASPASWRRRAGQSGGSR
jgi:AraC-like DNA-binding protein